MRAAGDHSIAIKMRNGWVGVRELRMVVDGVEE